MLDVLLKDNRLPPDRDAIVAPARTVSWGWLRADAARVERSLRAFAGKRVGLRFDASAEACSALAALAAAGTDVFLFDAGMPESDASRVARDLRVGILLRPRFEMCPEVVDVDDCQPAAWSGASTVTILTSGSTGKPKAVRHTWESLQRPVRRNAGCDGPRWFLTYRPNLYAGLQVLLQCMANHGTLVVPDGQSDPAALAALMRAARVEFVSATPSYFRRLLMHCDAGLLAGIDLIQITLGGEVVTQDILDALHRTFPRARLVHIYATTELGRCFSVTDGVAGFPPRFLDGPSSDGVEMRVRDDELQVRSANAMKCYDPYSGITDLSDSWFSTGDIVALAEDRVVFVGRKSDLINVGGQKVSPLEVELVIRGVPGVRDVRVFGKSSPIVGQVVACDVVPAGGTDKDALLALIREQSRAQLGAARQPRLINLVDSIALTSAGKTARSEKI